MPSILYVDRITDPETGTVYEIQDTYAREQLAHKVEKTIVQSLPSKPTTKDAWLAMEPFLYYVPISGQDNEYEVWTLFFVGDPTVASDYTDTNNYVWAKIAETDVDLSNFSTKGHTHEVIPEVDVEDHDYTPQGTVESEFQGNQGTTGDNTHSHTFTPQGSITGTFSHTGNTGSSQTGVTLTKEKLVLQTKILAIHPTTLNLNSTSTSADRATGGLEGLAQGDVYADKALIQGISVSNGVLSFVPKKLSTAGTVTGVSGTVATQTVTFDSSGDVNATVANGNVTSDDKGPILGSNTDVNDPTHTHTNNVSGNIEATFNGTAGTTSSNTHNHTFTPSGKVRSGFRGMRANLKHKVDSKKVRTSPDQEDPSGYVFDWYGIRYPENASSRFKERIGNMDMHRMLPIQTKMRRCILGDDGEVKYYLDDRDSTKRAGSQEGYVTSKEDFMTKIETDEIRDETETIEKIEGKSCAWNQLVASDATSVTVTSGHKYYAVISGTASIATSSGTAINVTGGTDMIIDLTILGIDNLTTVAQVEEWLEKNIGKSSYYPYCSGELLSYGGKMVNWNQLVNTDTTKVTATSGHKFYAVISGTKSVITGDGSSVDVTGGTDTFIDLTLMFGAGNEPDLEECEKLFVKDYYDYDEGTWRNLISTCGCGTGQKTVGFNQWDEEWKLGRFDTSTGGYIIDNQIMCKNTIEVLPNKSYNVTIIGGDSTKALWIILFDKNKNVISYLDWSTTLNYHDGNSRYCTNGDMFTTSSSAAYMMFYVTAQYGTTYNHDICINISDPKRNGTYEPYNAHIYNHDITTMTGINPNTGEREVVFETGMKSAGSVYDRLYNDGNGNAKAYKVCGDVDLGTLNWVYTNIFYANLTGSKINDDNTTANIVCPNYTAAPANRVYYDEDKTIGIWSLYNGSVIISDSIYTDAATFKAAMQGVQLIYELATPILYTDLQWADGSPVILPFEIEVEHNGTIENTPNITSGAPVMCAPDLTMKKYVLTQGANLDGSDGQVMVEIPEHWRKVYRVNESGTDYVYAKISPYPQEGWHHVEKNYVGAFEASIVDGKLSSSSDIKDLVYSHDANGKIVVSCNLSTSRMPKTYQYNDNGTTIDLNVDNYRMLARRRNDNLSAEWNGQTIQQWNDIAWLFFIEYATTNSQEQFKSERDANGFMQGGLGMGFSEFYNWGSYNNYYPVVPCGVTACLGNHSGEILITVAGANYKVNSYRGVEMPFGHLWKLVDGIKYYDNTIYRAVNPSDFSNAESTTGYVEVGSKGTSGGYVTTVKIQKDSGYDERFDGDLTPTGVGGDTASYYCDYYWMSSGWRCCLLGGYADFGSYDGFVCLDAINGLDLAYVSCGSRLCFLPSSVES